MSATSDFEPLLRPAPEIDRVRVERPDAVSRRERVAAGLEHARDLPERLSGVARVLEHLGAEHDVERRVVDLERLDRADMRHVRAWLDVRADVLRGDRGEERVVRHLPAADVEDARGCGDIAIACGCETRDEGAVVQVVGVDEARTTLASLRPRGFPVGESEVGGHGRRP